VVHLVDSRHPPSKLDLEMMEYLGELALPTLVVLTKIDRVSKGRRERTFKDAAEALRLDRDQLLPFSSKTGEGKEALLEAVDDLFGDLA
jgi:GTP-binding protein